MYLGVRLRRPSRVMPKEPRRSSLLSTGVVTGVAHESREEAGVEGEAS
jgi:hypothetical protein